MLKIITNIKLNIKNYLQGIYITVFCTLLVQRPETFGYALVEFLSFLLFRHFQPLIKSKLRTSGP